MNNDFLLGVTWCTTALRLAANRVELDQRGTVQNGERIAINAIVKSGNVRFARQLRELADVLDHEAKGMDGSGS